MHLDRQWLYCNYIVIIAYHYDNVLVRWLKAVSDRIRKYCAYGVNITQEWSAISKIKGRRHKTIDNLIYS